MTNNFDFNKLNSLLDAAAQSIRCGPECQKQKKRDELKNKYETAKTNLALAEPEYEIAKKNYYTYTYGKDDYDEFQESEYIKEAEEGARLYKNSYDEEISKIKLQLETYNGLLINFGNVADLYKKYKKENSKLFKKLKNITNDILTNQRKTYYKDQEIERSNGYSSYSLLLIIYIIVVICLAIFSLIYPSQLTFMIRILILCVFILLPFVSTWILGKIIDFIYWLFSFMPKNIYKENL
jgi:flagellar biosynthesis protein FliQ